jgi:hypothetical protein
LPELVPRGECRSAHKSARQCQRSCGTAG